ncbi:MAG: acyl-ACP--UDP-N-acetylglucosamine O-acyltransferase [Puniceicoccales bacterium]|jgi:UDP-N-acetylglucosamine acyltransferase|nr:acyl-ACP--UDP-N-acetylglucosamine O-acyltransferase [Puniceicoccales bacterium]
MPRKIHNTAIIEPGAQLADDVEVGAQAYIGKYVKIGSGSIVMHHATVDGDTSIGHANVIHPYAYLGGLTQDLKYAGEHTGLLIGNHNVFREFFTVHTATKPNESTIIGDDNTFLAYAHVAHDCVIGNGIIMSSHAALGGHVIIGDHANIGWSAGIHQFCRVGNYAMVSAMAKATMDVPPYMIADGMPARIRSFNRINLERHGFSEQDVRIVKEIYLALYAQTKVRAETLMELRKASTIPGDLYDNVCSFFESSDRGVC